MTASRAASFNIEVVACNFSCREAAGGSAWLGGGPLRDPIVVWVQLYWFGAMV
jgi:hypothetical protein